MEIKTFKTELELLTHEVKKRLEKTSIEGIEKKISELGEKKIPAKFWYEYGFGCSSGESGEWVDRDPERIQAEELQRRQAIVALKSLLKQIKGGEINITSEKAALLILKELK